jgi:ornithine carbamoyltransferase
MGKSVPGPRHLCRLLDLNRQQLLAIMEKARRLKTDRLKGLRFDPILQGKVAALVFKNLPSGRK